MTTLPQWLGTAAARGLEKQALPRSVIFWLGRQLKNLGIGGGGLARKTVQTVGPHVAQMPGEAASAMGGIGRGLGWLAAKPSRAALVPAAYYGGEAATAPFADPENLKGMRENYWGSVASNAGDTTANGMDRLKDWIRLPARAYLSGGAQNGDVANTIGGRGVFTPGSSQAKNTFNAGTGAGNAVQQGTMTRELSQYQRAQQALMQQAEKRRMSQFQALQQKDQAPGWFGGPSPHAAASTALEGYRKAFPGAPIPGIHEFTPPKSPLLEGGAAPAKPDASGYAPEALRRI
jgi:hypothetical protein